SMGGWKMTAARRAAARIVDTLTARDRFAVLTFDHEVTTPPDLPADTLSPAVDRHRFRAVQHLAAVEARGGTEMARPLRRAADLLLGAGPGRDRVLVLVTDGQVGDEDALLADLSGSLAELRVHTVGIDTAVNAGFLRRLASGGGGHCELVESEDRLDEAMDAVHRRIGTPLVTGLRLSGGDGFVLDQDSITPTRLPDLFAGAPLVVAGRYRGGEAPSAAITVAGTTADGSPWSRPVTAVQADDADLAPFWARGRIRDLEDRYVSAPHGQAELEKAIVDTSVRFNVLSRFTAFVAVDTVVVNEGGTLKRVTQPVDLPAGWEMEIEAALPVGMPMFGAPPPAPAAAAPPQMMQHRQRDSLDVMSTRTVKSVRPAAPKPAAPAGHGHMSASMIGRHTMTTDELDAFAADWLDRLSGADDLEKALAELLAALRQISGRIPVDRSAELSALIRTLETGDADTRRDAATTFLNSLRKPQRRPFWKR
ncbi:MAG: VWA domain-containing protein, partial [Catenulispora sp.]|nr:VWA domain-containing protein [Catenulispora sp.]